MRVQDQPLDLDRTYTLAVPDFLLLGGDGYKMFLGQRVLVGPDSGTLMSVALEKYIAARKEITRSDRGPHRDHSTAPLEHLAGSKSIFHEN